MRTIEEISALLDCTRRLLDRSFDQVREFVQTPANIKLAHEYAENLKKRDVDLGFNLFAIVSDLYFRENFHSDILAVCLNPSSKHGQRDAYLQLFLKYLNEEIGVKLDYGHYENAEVVTEEERVDVLIRDDTSMHAIIIENKMNNAVDQPGQLPGYLKKINGRGYTTDAIIYLRLNGNQGPDTSTWTADDKKMVNPLLKVICAYDETSKDLHTGWILKCAAVPGNLEAAHIFRQYGDIIKHLGGNIMNKPLMDKFYTMMLKPDALDTALSLKAMVDDLIEYRWSKIMETFKHCHEPFGRLNPYHKEAACFVDIDYPDSNLELHVRVEPNRYIVALPDYKYKKASVEGILTKMGRLAEFTLVDDEFVKAFKFPQEEDALYEQIRSFIKRLSEVLKEEKKKAK
jgi:PD-(D/E)XK nuclease superfamily